MLNHNFPVVLYGCEKWSFVLTQQLRVRVSEKRG